MLNISVDEAYAFDYLSILQVKSDRDASVGDSFFNCYSQIANQIGDVKAYRIIESKQYLDLVAANEEIFIAVDKAKKDEVPASYVDNLNYKRYLLKRALQEEFFSGQNISEKKIGYV